MANEKDQVISDEEAQAKLKEMMPELYAPEPSAGEKKGSVTVESAPAYGPYTGAIVGAGTGYAADKLGLSKLPNTPDTSRQYKAAKLAETLSTSEADRALEALEGAKTAHSGTVDTAFNQHLNAQRELQAAAEERAIAEALHKELMPAGNLGKEIPPDASGAKWQTKVVGDLSPAAESSTGSARLYNQAKELPPSVSEKYNLTNLTNKQGQGLLVPNTLDTDYLTPAQKAAKEKLTIAHAKHELAMENAAKAQYELEKLRGSIPKPVAMAQNLYDRTNRVATKAMEKAEMLAPETTNAVKQAGKFVGKIPGPLSGALSGYQGVQGVQKLQKGETGEGILDLMSGAGGALMMYPHPYAKVAGAALQVPPLLYEGYKLATDKK